MATTLFSKQSWGSNPTNKISASYEYARDSANMKYRFKISVAACTGDSYFGYPIYADIKLDGSWVATGLQIKSASPSQWSDALVLQTSYYTVSNKISGTTSCQIRIYSGSGSSRDTTYGTYSLTVTAYNSTISAPGVKAGAVCKITINKSKSSYVHDLKYRFGTSGSWRSIVAKTTASIYSWTVPASEAYAAMGNNKSVTCQLACNTFANASDTDSEKIGNSYTISITVSANAGACAPTVVLSVVPDAATRQLTGAQNKIIKYITNAALSVTATAKNGAAITSYKIMCTDGKYSNAESGTLNAVEAASFIGRATDSRGYSGEDVSDLTLIEYIKLTCKCTATAPDPETGATTVTVSGNFFNGSFGNSNNALTVKYRYKTRGGSYGDWITISSSNVSKSGNTYTARTQLTLDYTQSYVFQATVSDSANTTGVTSAEKAITSIPTFDWSKDDFKFNVEVSLKNGKHLILGDGASGQNILYGRDYSGNLVRLISLSGSGNNIVIGQDAGGNVGRNHSGGTYINAGEAGNIYAIIDGANYKTLNGYNLKAGSVSVTPSAADTPTGKAVSFETSFSSTPRVVVGIGASSVPGTTVRGVSAGGVSNSGFTAYVTRTNTTATTLSWVASDIGNS